MTPEEIRMRKWAQSGGGLSALQAVDAALAGEARPGDVAQATAPIADPRPVVQATDSEQIPAVRNAPLPKAPEPRDMTWRYLAEGLGGLAGRGPQTATWQAIDSADLAQQQGDLSSRASAVARRRMAPMLLTLGLSQRDIESLSASDLAEMAKGGNLVSSLAGARAKAQAAAAAREQELADRDYKATEDRAMADYTGNTAQGKMDRSIAHGSAVAGRQEDSQRHALQMQMNAAALQASRDRQNRKADEGERIAAEDRRTERERERQNRASRIEMEKEYATLEASLDALEDKLEARAGDDALPGDENMLERGAVAVKSYVGGGSGRSSEDSLLRTDLDQLGNAAFRLARGQVANTANEIADAKGIFRGDGTAASALQAIRENRERLRKVQAARLSVLAAGGTPEEAQEAARQAGGGASGAVALPPDEAELGIEVE